MRVFPYGETYEGRTLYLVVFSSPENLNRLNEIKSNIHKLSDPRTTTNAEAENIIASTPPIAWLSYGVHGNEASCSEAALNVMYQLAARSDDEVSFLLKNSRYRHRPASQSRRARALRQLRNEPQRREAGGRQKCRPSTTKTGPPGRTNHYFFDLNRDWAWLTQQESRARVKAYQEWKPAGARRLPRDGLQQLLLFLSRV